MDPYSNIVVTEQELFAFYHIDRVLFYKLVFHLGREQFDVMQAIAFWMWLGLIHKKNADFSYFIVKFPEHILDAVFLETLNVLRIVEDNNEFVTPNDILDIPILQSIMGTRMVNFRYFLENRLDVLLGVGYQVNHTCLRAFRDLTTLVSDYRPSFRPYNYYQYPDHHTFATNNTYKNKFTLFGGDNNVGFGYNPSYTVGDINVPLIDPNHFPSSQEVLNNNGNVASSSNNNSNISTDNYSLMEFFARMQLSENRQSQEGHLPSGDRTIFLTFSKGYAIFEPELRDFLSRSFGDIIESLHMQEVVSEDDQPLFAKLVVRDAMAMHIVLNGRRKAKFSINGKHVWARKYVHKKHKNHTSTPPSPNDQGDNNQEA